MAKAVAIDSPVPTHSSAASTPSPAVNAADRLDRGVAPLGDHIGRPELARDRLSGTGCA